MPSYELLQKIAKVFRIGDVLGLSPLPREVQATTPLSSYR